MPYFHTYFTVCRRLDRRDSANTVRSGNNQAFVSQAEQTGRPQVGTPRPGLGDPKSVSTVDPSAGRSGDRITRSAGGGPCRSG